METDGLFGADAAIRYSLAPLRPLLDQPGVIELCINRPGEVFVEHISEGWTRHEVPQMTYAACEALGVQVASYLRDGFSEKNPLLSATLPTKERIQFVHDPACEKGTIAIGIRKPSEAINTLAEFDRDGLFAKIRPKQEELTDDEVELLRLKEAGKIREFIELAVRSRQTIVVSGATGSGKTRFMKGIAQSIPLHERLISIEDAREVFLPNHINRLHLIYSKGQQGIAQVTPKNLLEACLRLRPDRILLAELRGEECFYFMRNAASGHPGSITSVHGGSPALAFEQMTLMVKESAGGASLSHEDIGRLLRSVVNVVVQFSRVGTERFVSEIYFEPAARLEMGRTA